jgi:redox-sensitive bicupin YhaK (pirin superfamily)
VGEGIGADVALGLLLQAVVADRACGRHAFLHIPFLQQLAGVMGRQRPRDLSGQAIRNSGYSQGQCKSPMVRAPKVPEGFILSRSAMINAARSTDTKREARPSTATEEDMTMRNTDRQAQQESGSPQGEAAVELLLQPREKDLGDFSVRRLLPTAKRTMVGPWIFFDHMGPADFPPGKGVNIRPHPHINLATVTYLFEGEILHRDSLGSLQPIVPGDINLMVAGRGIVHSERERPEITAAAHRLHGLQLWLALPDADEEIEPAFHHYPGGDIPTGTIDGVPVRVMMGSAYGVTSPVQTFADTLYVEAHLKASRRLTLPAAPERALYVVSGALRLGGMTLPEHSMAILSEGANLVVEAEADSRIALIGGEPLGHRFIDWNFVSSRKERIEQAKTDWRGGRFPRVPGDEEEFIPLPD